VCSSESLFISSYCFKNINPYLLNHLLWKHLFPASRCPRKWHGLERVWFSLSFLQSLGNDMSLRKYLCSVPSYLKVAEITPFPMHIFVQKEDEAIIM
jgi:hypothetical protein